MTTTDARKRLRENARTNIAARLFEADTDAEHTHGFEAQPHHVRDRYLRLAQAAEDAMSTSLSPTTGGTR